LTLRIEDLALVDYWAPAEVGMVVKNINRMKTIELNFFWLCHQNNLFLTPKGVVAHSLKSGLTLQLLLNLSGQFAIALAK